MIVSKTARPILTSQLSQGSLQAELLALLVDCPVKAVMSVLSYSCSAELYGEGEVERLLERLRVCIPCTTVHTQQQQQPLLGFKGDREGKAHGVPKSADSLVLTGLLTDTNR